MKWITVAVLALAAVVLPVDALAARMYRDKVTERSGNVNVYSVVDEDIEKGIGIDTDGDERPDLFLPATMIIKIEYDPTLRAVRDQNRADESFREGDWRNAAARYEAAINNRLIRANVKEYCRYQLGESCLRMGDFKKAIESFRSVAPKYRLAPEAQIGILKASIMQGDFQTAAAAVGEMQKFPKDFVPVTNFWNGRLLMVQGKTDDARKLFARLATDKNNPELALEARVYDAVCKAVSDKTGALDDLDKCLADADGIKNQKIAIELRVLAMNSRADIYYTQQKYFDALFVYSLAREKYPDAGDEIGSSIAGIVASTSALVKDDKMEGPLKNELNEIRRANLLDLRSGKYANTLAAKLFDKKYPDVDLKF